MSTSPTTGPGEREVAERPDTWTHFKRSVESQGPGAGTARGCEGPPGDTVLPEERRESWWPRSAAPAVTGVYGHRPPVSALTPWHRPARPHP